MFWNLFIFCGHSAREPASIICNDEQGDLFCGRIQEAVWATANTDRNSGEVFEKCRWMDRRVEISEEKVSGSKGSMYGHVAKVYEVHKVRMWYTCYIIWPCRELGITRQATLTRPGKTIRRETNLPGKQSEISIFHGKTIRNFNFPRENSSLGQYVWNAKCTGRPHINAETGEITVTWKLETFVTQMRTTALYNEMINKIIHGLLWECITMLVLSCCDSQNWATQILYESSTVASLPTDFF